MCNTASWAESDERRCRFPPTHALHETQVRDHLRYRFRVYLVKNNCFLLLLLTGSQDPAYLQKETNHRGNMKESFSWNKHVFMLLCSSSLLFLENVHFLTRFAWGFGGFKWHVKCLGLNSRTGRHSFTIHHLQRRTEITAGKKIIWNTTQHVINALFNETRVKDVILKFTLGVVKNWEMVNVSVDADVWVS